MVLGPAVARAELELKGIDGALARNVRTLVPLDGLACDTAAAEVRRLYNQAPQQIRQALEPFGHYEPSLESSLRFTESCWKATFRVDPGPVTRIARSAIDVAPGLVAEVNTLLAAKPLAPGTPLNHAAYDRLRDQLRRAALDAGYLDAAYTANRVVVDPAARSAEITLTLDTGRRYSFGDIETDIDFLEPDLVRRMIRLESDEWVARRRIGAVRRDLLATGYFADVDIRTSAVPENDTLNVLIHGTPSRKTSYAVGVGVSSDVGPFLTGDFTNRRVNRRGHRIEAGLELGGVKQDVQFEYRIPGADPLSDWYSAYVGAEAEDTDDAIESQAVNFGVRRSTAFGRGGRLEPFLDYTIDRLTQDGIERTSTTLAPGVALTLKRVRGDVRPTGWRARFEVSGAVKGVLSDASFLRASADTRLILPFVAKSRVLLRGSFGFLDTDAFDDLPTRWRFFGGGDSSVRGFDYESLGPVDSNGEATGGEWTVTGSAELDVPVRGNWSVALFTDIGQVGIGKIEADGLPYSVGFGVRWLSPVGPVRVDLAFPQQGSDDSFRFHLSLGPDL